MRKQLVALVLAPILAISSAQAADAVRWEDLPKKIGTGNAREYTIVTKDGNTQKGLALDFSPKGVRLNLAAPVIPWDEVAEIRVHHHQRMSDAAAAPAARVFRDVQESWLLFFWALFPALVVTYGATAPPAIAVEAVRRMLPDKVIKVAP